ncbi:MAG: O-antigen ligase family protein [Coriobacteriia bacterium]|nr:O-antigen ligase family protein [Coriobacteriia bacterium]
MGTAGIAGSLIAAGVVAGCAVVPAIMSSGGYNPFGPAKAALLAFSVAAVLAGMALEPARARGAIRALAVSKASWFLGGYVLLSLLATLSSLDVRASVFGSYPEYQGVVALLGSLILAAGAVALAGDDVLGLLGRALTVSMLAVGAYGLAQMLGLDPVSYRAGLDLARARSTLGNASNLGLWLVIASPYVLRLAREARGAWRVAAGIALGLAVVVLIGTSSRGAWLAAAVAGLVWVALEAPAWTPAARRRVALASAAIAVVGAVAVMLVAPTLASRASSALDANSGTAAWRRSVWSSAIRMSVDRPVLGWGPNTFRFAYPLYRGAELSADSADPQVVTDAHDLFVNTLAERGPLTLIALAGWFVAIGVGGARAARAGDRAGADRIAVAATLSSLAGGIVATGFHYLTPDTGVLFFTSALLATLFVAPDAPAASPATKRDGFARGGTLGLWLAVGLSLAVGAALLGVLAADRAMAEGLELAQAGASTTRTADEFDRAQAAAPWDPMFLWAEGHAALLQLQGPKGDPDVYESGIRAFEAAEALSPHDTRLQREHADLVLAAGLVRNDQALFEEARGRYGALMTLDPNNGSLWIGRGSALAGMGRWEDAVVDYERAVALVPDSIPGWGSLAIAYEQVGREHDAAKAQSTAEELQLKLTE